MHKELNQLNKAVDVNRIAQQPNEINSISKLKITAEIPMENKKRNRIMNSLQEEEMIKQKVLEKYMERYTVEGRQSIIKSKMISDEESKIFKKDQIQKVRNKLLNDKLRYIGNFEFKKNTAMIIDDNQFSKTILKTILKEIGVEVVGEINTGVEALELAEEIKPEYIFVDIKMSDIDGITATKFIIRKLPKTIIIVCSSHYDDNILACLEDLKVKGFIQKPFAKENVVEVINEIGKMLERSY